MSLKPYIGESNTTACGDTFFRLTAKGWLPCERSVWFLCPPYLGNFFVRHKSVRSSLSFSLYLLKLFILSHISLLLYIFFFSSLFLPILFSFLLILSSSSLITLSFIFFYSIFNSSPLSPSFIVDGKHNLMNSGHITKTLGPAMTSTRSN